MNKLEQRYDEVSTLINTVEILIDNTSYKDIFSFYFISVV